MSSLFRVSPDLIPPDLRTIVKALLPARSYVVGGVVREMAQEFLCGRQPQARTLARKDWDLATASRPERTLRRLRKAGFAVLPLGIEHGTVVVHGRDPLERVDPARRYEVTTFRYDRLCDGRHAVVEFAETLEEDLARRDFTVNALALDPESGQILDLQGGLDDLQRRVIRAVGDPEKRFEEDALRLIRAIRFALAIDGRIEQRTWGAIGRNAHRIAEISAERVRDEILKILTYPRPSRAFLMMRESGLLHHLLPELDAGFGVEQNLYHADDVGVHTLFVVDAVAPKYPWLRWIALLHDLGKPATRSYPEDKEDCVFYQHETVGARMGRRIMRRLKFPTREMDLAALLIRVHMYPIEPGMAKKTLRRWLHRIGREHFRSFLRLRMADRAGNRKQPRRLEPGLYEAVRMLRQIERDQDALDLKDLEINGLDLLEMGLKPGPLVGRILRELLEQVLADPRLNERATLLDLARRLADASELDSTT